jgi:hypothetical protein
LKTAPLFFTRSYRFSAINPLKVKNKVRKS